MNKSNRARLVERVTRAAEAALAAQAYVSCVDVLVGIGWLDTTALQRWRQGQIDCLESAVQTGACHQLAGFGLWRHLSTVLGR